jgi:hypothetical protein
VPADEKGIGADDHFADAAPGEGRESRLDLLLGTGPENRDRLIDGTSGLLHLCDLRRGVRVVGIDEQCDQRRLRGEFAQDPEALGGEAGGEHADPGGVAAGMIEAADESVPDRIVADRKTIGIVAVAFFAATAAGRLPAAMTATERCTRSAARAGKRS